MKVRAARCPAMVSGRLPPCTEGEMRKHEATGLPVGGRPGGAEGFLLRRARSSTRGVRRRERKALAFSRPGFPWSAVVWKRKFGNPEVGMEAERCGVPSEGPRHRNGTPVRASGSCAGRGGSRPWTSRISRHKAAGADTRFGIPEENDRGALVPSGGLPGRLWSTSGRS